MRRLGCTDYRELHRVSVEEPERFWPALIDDLGIEFSTPFDQVLDDSRGIEWCRWFVGGKLNVAWNCVHKWRGREGEAVVGQAEDGERSALTWAELADEVYRLAEGLASLGIGPGDAVGIFLPMSPQVAISARLADAKAKALITADGSLRRGQVVPMKEIADEALRGAPTVTHIVVWH